ncbi:MAG: PKD domain-containing protein [Chitinophagales bacterium]
MKQNLPIFIVVCMLFALVAQANVYTVSTNANSGIGTLRQAISDANNHIGPDSIKFNIMDSSVTGRTIILNSALPSISEQLIIDGTSQNKGPAFGISFTKILVTASISIPQCFNINADNCEIYGLFITGFQMGILVNNAYSQIGGINKGNVLVSCSSACIKLQSTDHSAIVGNLVGVDTSGNIGAGLAGNGIELSNSYAITIGGHSSSSSNVISGNSYGVKLDNSQYCTINGNFIGTLADGITVRANQYGIKANGSNINIEIGGDTLFKRNIISGNTSSGIYGYFDLSSIQGNYIGTDLTGTTSLGNGDYGIYLREGSSDNLIGGETEFASNLVAYNGQEAITFEASNCIKNTVRRNITFCNSQTLGNGGLNFNNGDNHLDPPQLIIANSTGVSGLTYPSGILDIYQDDTCTHCEGRLLISSVNAGANGVFVYIGSLSGTITATVTDTSGNTSEYTACTPADNITCIAGQFTTVPAGICTGTTISFIDETVTQPGSALQSWQWSFGDGGTSVQQFPDYVYSINGTFTITLIVTNNLSCSDTASLTVIVTGAPVSSFNVIAESCVGSQVSFNDQSTAGNGATLTSWQWDFGDGGSANIQNPTHTFNLLGTYTITLTATNSNGCIDESSGTINIISQPVADFSFTQAGLQVSFTNNSSSSGHKSYLWNFGDGVFSNATDPTHIYSDFAVYSVCLSVYDSLCNTTDSLCQLIDLPDGNVNIMIEPLIYSPNPVNDVLTISGISFSEPPLVCIYDLWGRKLRQQFLPVSLTPFQLNVQSLNEGTYLLEIKKNEMKITFRIAVMH